MTEIAQRKTTTVVDTGETVDGKPIMLSVGPDGIHAWPKGAKTKQRVSIAAALAGGPAIERLNAEAKRYWKEQDRCDYGSLKHQTYGAVATALFQVVSDLKMGRA